MSSNCKQTRRTLEEIDTANVHGTVCSDRPNASPFVAHNSLPSVDVASWPPPLLTNGVQLAVVVPFRDQRPLQDRSSQLKRFIPHMEQFLSSIPNCRGAIIIVEQAQDGRKFNRGQLLNVGFELARNALPGVSFFITHDVDLLPSMEMRPVYANVPTEPAAVHLASVWNKYTYGTFIGGVLAFRPEDFIRVNGYPNNYWGWGLEDDQLALRMGHCKVRTLRVRSGSYLDLDPMNMKSVLERGQREEVVAHLPWLNKEMFQKGGLHLDSDWSQNGLRDLTYKSSVVTVRGLVHHHLVHLGPLDGMAANADARPL